MKKQGFVFVPNCHQRAIQSIFRRGREGVLEYTPLNVLCSCSVFLSSFLFFSLEWIFSGSLNGEQNEWKAWKSCRAFSADKTSGVSQSLQ